MRANRRGAALLSAVLLSVLLTACGPSPYTPETVDQLLESGAFAGEMEWVDGEVLCVLYGLDRAAVTEAAGYLAIDTASSADEVAVFVMQDEAAAQQAEMACRNRLAAQIDSYTTYGPDQVPRLEQAVVHRVGHTVLLAVGDPGKLSEALGR